MIFPYILFDKRFNWNSDILKIKFENYLKDFVIYCFIIT